MRTIAIIDYGMGNVRSVQKAIEYVAPNDHCVLTDNLNIIAEADRVVFPGQGAMGACMNALYEHKLNEVIKKAAKEKPFLVSVSVYSYYSISVKKITVQKVFR